MHIRLYSECIETVNYTIFFVASHTRLKAIFNTQNTQMCSRRKLCITLAPTHSLSSSISPHIAFRNVSAHFMLSLVPLNPNAAGFIRIQCDVSILIFTISDFILKKVGKKNLFRAKRIINYLLSFISLNLCYENQST